MKGTPGNHTELLNTGLPVDSPSDADKDLSAFFITGMVINLIILIAFFVWAYKQWNKK